MDFSGTDNDSRDQALFSRLREGDTSAFAALLSTYWRPIVRYANKMLNNPDAADDIAQDTFVKFWNWRSRWDPAAHPRAILHRVARNLALNEQRYARVRAKWVARNADVEQSRSIAPTQTFEEQELANAVKRAIEALPDRRREVFRLVRHSGLTYRQVAEVMGISVQTVANHMSAALADLRRVVDPLVENSSNLQPRRRPSSR